MSLSEQIKSLHKSFQHLSATKGSAVIAEGLDRQLKGSSIFLNVGALCLGMVLATGIPKNFSHEGVRWNHQDADAQWFDIGINIVDVYHQISDPKAYHFARTGVEFSDAELDVIEKFTHGNMLNIDKSFAKLKKAGIEFSLSDEEKSSIQQTPYVGSLIETKMILKKIRDQLTLEKLKEHPELNDLKTNASHGFMQEFANQYRQSISRFKKDMADIRDDAVKQLNYVGHTKTYYEHQAGVALSDGEYETIRHATIAGMPNAANKLGALVKAGIDISLTKEQRQSAKHTPYVGSVIETRMVVAKIKRQFNELTPEQLAKHPELKAFIKQKSSEPLASHNAQSPPVHHSDQGLLIGSQLSSMVGIKVSETVHLLQSEKHVAHILPHEFEGENDLKM